MLKSKKWVPTYNPTRGSWQTHKLDSGDVECDGSTHRTLLGWVALWVSFFVLVVREQILAIVSILCTFVEPNALHVVVTTFIVVYFTQTGH